MLPKPKDKLGYTIEEINSILKKRKISKKNFAKFFGINTVTIGKDNKPRYYICDVERTLYLLKNKDGKYHLWD